MLERGVGSTVSQVTDPGRGRWGPAGGLCPSEGSVGGHPGAGEGTLLAERTQSSVLTGGHLTFMDSGQAATLLTLEIILSPGLAPTHPRGRAWKGAHCPCNPRGGPQDTLSPQGSWGCLHLVLLGPRCGPGGLSFLDRDPGPRWGSEGQGFPFVSKHRAHHQ